MSQPVYPTLSKGPVVDDFVREPAYDPTLRSKPEDGAAFVMNTKTKVPKVWSIHYEDMTSTDYDTLDNFWSGQANCGAVVVKFTDPTNNRVYFVRFTDRPRYRLETTQQQRWRIDVSLEEAIGSYT